MRGWAVEGRSGAYGGRWERVKKRGSEAALRPLLAPTAPLQRGIETRREESSHCCGRCVLLMLFRTPLSAVYKGVYADGGKERREAETVF